MKIKTCSNDDITQLVEISIQSYLEHYTYLWEDGGKNYIKSNFNHNKLSEEFSNPNSVFFLIQYEQKPVGLLKLNIDKGIKKFPAGNSLELERIYFIKQASGRGLGKEAIDFVINFAKEKNKATIWLKVMNSSNAIDFYKRQGFVITDETYLDYPAIKNEFKKMFIMCRAI